MERKFCTDNNYTYFAVGEEDVHHLRNIYPHVNAKFLRHPHYEVSKLKVENGKLKIKFHQPKIKLLIAGQHNHYMKQEADSLIEQMKEKANVNDNFLINHYELTFLGKGWETHVETLRKAGYEVNHIKFAPDYIEEIFIGADVVYIDENAFFNVKKLQRVTVDPANEFFKDIDGVLYTKDGKTLILYPICYGQQPTDEEDVFTYPDSYSVPDGVEKINAFAFLKNGHLRDVILPETLKEIGDMAFFDCGRLGSYDYNADTDTLLGTGFTLPDGVEKIGSDAFSKCGNISPVLFIPESVREICHHAFFSCGGIKDVYLGASDESLIETGDAWLPKSIKAGPAWKAPVPKYGASRADAEELIEQHRKNTLNSLREEALKNG